MNGKKVFAVIGAMESETKYLLPVLDNIIERIHGGAKLVYGSLHNHEVVILRSGIGKVNAARSAQILADYIRPDYMINMGIAGGIDGSLSLGDIVIATGLIQHDFDVTAFGHAKGYMCTGDADDKPTVFHPDESLSAALKKAAGGFATEQQIKTGYIVTGDQFISDKTEKEKINNEFHALAAEMEGAAIAQIASLNHIPFAALRVISDLADGHAVKFFDRFEDETSQLSASIVTSLIYNF